MSFIYSYHKHTRVKYSKLLFMLLFGFWASCIWRRKFSVINFVDYGVVAFWILEVR